MAVDDSANLAVAESVEKGESVGVNDIVEPAMDDDECEDGEMPDRATGP